MKCLLCISEATVFFIDPKSNAEYFHCEVCDLKFIHPKFHLKADEELARYETHENDVDDEAYRNFVRPAFDLVRAHVPKSSTGLDFGCGPGPALATMLKDEGYSMSIYDPYFFPDQESLKTHYDFVVTTEVVEHLFAPQSTFALMVSLLKPGGRLIIMTAILDPSIDFANWYYRRDPTHVCFYSQKTLAYLKERFSFKFLKFVEPRTALLSF